MDGGKRLDRTGFVDGTEETEGAAIKIKTCKDMVSGYKDASPHQWQPYRTKRRGIDAAFKGGHDFPNGHGWDWIPGVVEAC